MSAIWPWMVLFGLGAFHGVNPGMGWLFAVCLGLQERRRRAVLAALLPIALGHALSVAAVVAVVVVLREAIPLAALRYLAAAVLILYGGYRAVRARHPRWVGMRVGFRDLTLWSFLMASAHGAGLMLIPVYLATNAHDAHDHHAPPGGLPLIDSPELLAASVVVHTLGHLLAAGVVALLVYEKLGLALLQKTWFNMDWAWAVALVVTGMLLLLW